MTPTWLKETGLQRLFAATKEAGGEARAVGGAVRDALMEVESGDVDVASTLTPEATIELAAREGWKAIPTGIDHGTVTLVLPERVVEVTTLRRDVETDGRRATVAFTDDWKEDAARRDFTMNALYMDAAGTLTDFFGGVDDLKAHLVRFIGDAGQRIVEDGLRSLRYFRFLASHGKPPADEAALAAITEKKAMVNALSGERIANEMRKLLSVENPAYSVRLMKQTGLAALVFGREIEPQNLIRLQMLEAQADYMISVCARVLILLGTGIYASTTGHPGLVPGSGGSASSATSTESQEVKDRIPGQARDDSWGNHPASWIAERWKLSRHEAAQLKLLTGLPKFDAAAPKHAHTRLLRLHGAPAYLDWLLMQAVLIPGIDIAPWVQLATDFRAPIFPVTAKDLMALGMVEGKALGERLAQLEARWEQSDYTLTREALLAN